MTDASTPPTSPVWQTRAWLIGIALLCIGPIYLAVLQGVRAHVTHQIEKNENNALPSLTLPVWGGGEVSLDDLRGKWVVLDFFRSQCASCFAEAPEIRRLAKSLDPEKAVLFGVLMDPVQGFDEAMSARTIERMGYEHPILVANSEFVDAFHGAGWSHVTPVTYIADPEGTIRTALRVPEEGGIERALPKDVFLSR
jgi:peroxiredoxin